MKRKSFAVSFREQTAEPRLTKRIKKLSERKQKLHQIRVSLFSLMGIAILFSVFEIQSNLALLFAGVFLLVFLYFVRIYGKVAKQLTLFESRLRVEKRQRAMENLDWSLIPELPVHLKFEARGPEEAFLTDLNLIGDKSFLRFVNLCVSTAGILRLFELFRKQQIEAAELIKRQTLIRELLKLRQMRYSYLARTRVETLSVDSSRLSSILGESLSELRSPFELLPIFVAQFLMVAGFLWASARGGEPLLLIPVVIVLIENVRLRSKLKTGAAYSWSLSADVQLDHFGQAVRVLEKFAGTQKAQLKELLVSFRGEKAASKRLKQLETVSGALGVRQNFIVHAFCNLILPWDLMWTYRLDQLRRKLVADLPEWTRALAEFEAHLCLAQYAESLGEAAYWPELASQGAVLDAEDLKHPLIPRDRVIGNPIHLEQGKESCVLLTGSNMSGKSTFLRAVGLNFVLARAGAPVMAKSFRFQNFIVMSSLSGADSLDEGLSSFYAEVVRLKKVLSWAEEKRPVLFLIDEIFRGTNNRERLIGSRAYIQAIVKTGAVGIVSSHDLELAQLEELKIGIHNYHFRETIRDGKMDFSYRKESGACPTTNALEVMKMSGLPT